MNSVKVYKQGVALLMTMLIVSAILAIGLTIASITYKQLVLSSTIRNSTRAFYSADSVLECILYNDKIRPTLFATSSDTYAHVSNPNTSVGTISDCLNSTTRFRKSDISADSNSAITEFTVNSNNDIDMSAIVTVEKNGSSTIISVRGRNHNVANTNSDPRTVERGLRIRY